MVTTKEGDNSSILIDQGGDKKFFAMIPKIVFFLGLNPYDLALYLFMKQSVGESETSYCAFSTSSMSKILGISIGQIVNSKKKLREAGLIEIVEEENTAGKPRHMIFIRDIWELNLFFCGQTSLYKVQTSLYEVQTSLYEVQTSLYEVQTSLYEPKKNKEEEPYKKNKIPRSGERADTKKPGPESGVFDPVLEEKLKVWDEKAAARKAEYERRLAERR
jgi:predicted transcriptional regulator